jgi:hypothetical protein
VQVGESSIRYDEDRAAAVPEVGVQQGLSYTVRSQLVLPTPKQLDQVTDFSNPAYAQYERLPADTPAAISTIAREVTRGAITPFQKLLAIQEYLHGFRYDQRVSGSQDIRSLVHFLTVTKRGFCQQFATAMAVLARALGYPARVAVGFTPGTFDAETGAWRVSTRNAHAWVEVLFPGYGWMAFEPTPNRDNPVADNYLRQNSTRLTPCQLQGTCGSETGGTKGTAGGGDRTKSLSGRLKDREQQSLGGGGPVGVPGSPTRAPSHPYRLPLLLLGLILALGAGLFLVLVPLAKIVGRRVRLARAGPPRQVVLTAYRTFAGRAGDVGLGKADGETIREYRDRLRAAVRFSNGDLERLSSITAKAAYSVEEISKEQAKDASAAARKAIHDVRRSTSAGTRLVGMFRPGI